MQVSWRNWALLLALIATQLAGLAFFVNGFFPSKVVLAGDGVNHLDVPPPVFDKVILMVIDAMRSDFMFSENSKMDFVHSLIGSGKALGFTAFSNPPTVTLPRLKGLTTGSTPNFLDAILNIAEDDTSSTLGDQDSWIKQLYRQNRKIHMFGDDTWIKLFPTYFDKYEGTSSFYVSDFTEVDNNVTRHIDDELADREWDCLILHYLGLDHIGHKGGPDSSNMPVKQREMDGIIKKIYSDYVSKNQNTLFVVLGDHGMNEIGNHGGSSISETSAALMMVSDKFVGLRDSPRTAPLPVNDEFTYYQRIQQIDLVPSLATLLGFPIPKNNLGVFINRFKGLYKKKDYINILLNNAHQLKDLVEQSFGKQLTKPDVGDGSEFGQFSKLWSELEKTKEESKILDFIISSQSKLAESATNYNYRHIYTGIALYSASGLILLTWYILICVKTEVAVPGSIISLFALILSFSNFGSSLVEEEYQIWWLLTVIYLTGALLFFKPAKGLWIFTVLALSLRLIRGWNNSGQKFNLQSNLKVASLLSGNFYNTFAIVIFYFILLFLSFKNGGLFRIFDEVKPLIFFIVFTFFTLSLWARVITSYLEDEAHSLETWSDYALETITLAKQFFQKEDLKKCLEPIYHLFYYFMAAILCFRVGISFFNFRKQSHSETFFSDISSITLIFLMNQSSSKNILIYAVFLVMRQYWAKLTIALTPQSTKYGDAEVFKFTLVHASFILLMQHLSFFSMGNTNSLSTVDLTNAFNGLSEYNLIACGILTFVSNWAAPVFWSLSFLILTLENAQSLRPYKYSIVWYKTLIFVTFYSIIGAGLLLACFSLRFHLFIWTVFSPKLLYFGSWYVFMNLGVDYLLSLVLVALY